jgi:hypothetical protein
MSFGEYKNLVSGAYSFDGCPIKETAKSTLAIVQRCNNRGVITWKELRFWPGQMVTYFRFKEKNSDAVTVPRLKCKTCEAELNTYAFMCPEKAWIKIRQNSSSGYFNGYAKISHYKKSKILETRPVYNETCPNCKITPWVVREQRIRELNEIMSKASAELTRLQDKNKMDLAAKSLANAKSLTRVGKKPENTSFFQTVNAAAQITKQLATI